MNDYGTPKLWTNADHWFNRYIAKNKAANLVYGSGFILVSDKPEIQKFLTEFMEYNDLYNFLYKLEYGLSLYGRRAIWWEPPNNYDIERSHYKLHINNPLFPYYVETSGEKTTTLWIVESRRRKNFGQKPFITMIKLGLKEIAFTGDFSSGTATLMPNPIVNRFIITKTQPFQDIMNLPEYNKFFLSINFINPDTKSITPNDYKKLDEAQEYITRDLATSENRLILTDDMKPNTTDNVERDKIRKSTIIVRNSASAILGGVDVKAEFLKANPNAALLWENFNNQFNWMLERSGYSYDRTNQGQTATENHYAKGNDIQTTAIKRKIRELHINKLIGSILINEGLWDGENKPPFIFKINDHFLIDKEKNFQLLAQQKELGVKTLQEIIMETQNKTPAEAESELKKVVKERKDFPELFNDNNGNEIIQNGFTSKKNSTNPTSQTNDKQKGVNNQYSK